MAFLCNRRGALLAFAAAACFGVAASSPAQKGYSLKYDDFADGFSIDVPGAKWAYFGAGPFVGSDGVATTSSQGLNVKAKGVNPLTGEPAFTLTLGQEGAPDNPYGLPPVLDHVKWLAYTTNMASTGWPGFDAVAGQELRFDVWMAGQSYGNDQHPFGPAVTDPNDDIRLACSAMNTIDLESMLVADFFLTNKRIYVIYERLPFARTATNNYAAFTYAIPVGERKPWHTSKFSIAYNRTTNVLRWLIDDEEVFRVTQPGYRINREFMVLDHGGTEELVVCRQRNVGFGMFTLLDAALPNQQPLVQLTTDITSYISTAQPSVYATFIDPLSEPKSRIWGEGAEFSVKKVNVSSR